VRSTPWSWVDWGRAAALGGVSGEVMIL
jgi:hypothetical protein